MAKKKQTKSGRRDKSAVHSEMVVQPEHVKLDKDGNLVIRNREVAKKVQDFVTAEEAKPITTAGTYVRCFVLRLQQ